MNKLRQVLEKALKQEEYFVDSETGNINYIKVKDSADHIDEKLISILSQNKELKYKFFIKIKDVYVFNIQDFKFFLDENKIDNSYTKYANRIGLSFDDDFIKDNDNVVLGFPFKDCVLEGGLSTEEGIDVGFEYSEKNKKYDKYKTSRKEIFFNQVLAQDEIDRLFDKKALVNWKRFTKDCKKDGEAVKEIKRDGKGLIKENLIIKGNNLLALHSLKSEFTGKIKLIYIDPPYNTGNDGFSYNDNFNHSTWLTFMKNRLEIAKELLKDDGVIFVQSDDNEQAYLKVLMDEIFGKNNYINTIIIKAKAMAGASGGGEDKRLKKNFEFISFYGKNYELANFKQPNPVLTKISDYIEEHKENNVGFYYTRIIKNYGDKKIIGTIKAGDGGDIKIYKHNNYEFSSISKVAQEEKIIIDDVYRKYFDDIFMVTNAQTSILTKVNNFVKNKNELISYEYIPKTGKDKGKLTTKMVWNETLVVWFKDTAIRNKEGVYKSESLGSLWTDISWGRLDLEGSVSLKSGKKPENLLKTIIEMATENNDIILDYHLGSGTTCAVAHKMNRQYIGVEQLDYYDNDSVIRLKNVINGDDTGISKEINWKGGGNFIYCELSKWNERAAEEIQNVKDLSSLVKLFDSLCEKYFLNYNVNIKNFKEKIIKEENFKKLSLNEQKKMFLSMLDLNQMYVQESEMSDKKFGISKEDQKLTKEFYQK